VPISIDMLDCHENGTQLYFPRNDSVTTVHIKTT
jgi:hypothetical protein